MKKIFIIAAKELKSYFRSPIAYIVLVITISIFNMFFFVLINEGQEATLRDILTIMEFMFIFIIPLLTMKIFAEEKQTGTIEFLVTTPTTNTVIVLGKFLGSLLFFTLLMSVSIFYYIIIEIFASPDKWTILSGIAGIWLEGVMFVAIGVLTSSWTRNQILAAITSYVILFLLFFSLSFTEHVGGNAAILIRYFSTKTHAENFIAGLINTVDVVYYLSAIFICLTLTRLSVENRLWR